MIPENSNLETPKRPDISNTLLILNNFTGHKEFKHYTFEKGKCVTKSALLFAGFDERMISNLLSVKNPNLQNLFFEPGIIPPPRDLITRDILKKTLNKTTNNILQEHQLNNESESFILDNNTLPQHIDHAVGSIKIGNSEYRYYGVKLIQNITTKEGGLKPEKVNALVLEDGHIISNKNKSGITFDFNSQMNLRKNRWSEDSIAQFRKEANSINVSFKEVFEQFKAIYDSNMVFECQEWYSLNALWDMSTYFFDLIDKTIIIKHEGMSGGGKSKGMRISANLSFNGRKFLCPTPSTFFRYRHNNKSMLCIEEAEKLFDDSNRKNKDDSDLIEYLNGSYEKGNFVPRQNDKEVNQTDEFDPFGFTRIGSIKALKGALEKRSITLFMIPSPKNDSRGNTEIPTESFDTFVKARNLAYINGLKNYKILKSNLENVTNDYGLSNREWLISKPIIAIAKCIDETLEKEMGVFLAKLFERRDDNINEDSWEKILADEILNLCKTQEGFISNDRLKRVFLNRIGRDKITTQTITDLMGKIGLKNFKARDTTGNDRGYNLNLKQAVTIFIRQKLFTIEEMRNNLSDLSVCQIDILSILEEYTDKSSDKLSDKNEIFSDNLTKRQKKDGSVDEEYIKVDEKVSESLSLSENSKKERILKIVSSNGSFKKEKLCEIYGNELIDSMLWQGELSEIPVGILRLRD